MGAIELVSVRDDNQGGNGLDSLSKEAQDIKGGLIGPVRILENEHTGRPNRQRAQEGGPNLIRSRAMFRERLKLAAYEGSHVEERA
jgi:hypothetical protein